MKQKTIKSIVLILMSISITIAAFLPMKNEYTPYWAPQPIRN